MSSLHCPQGHRWAGDEAGACPVCGETALPGSPAATLTTDGLREMPSASGDAAATLPQGQSHDVKPPEVPGYDIERELGRGGMGVVYLARQTELGRHVALKMILAGLHASAPERERFRIEARAAAQLQHPNIVQIHEIGEADGRPYLALEYVPGGSLAAQLRGQPWPARDAAALIEALARGIDHAHARGIIHRDLKPANVLLIGSIGPMGPVGPIETPKITDFGLAKQIQDAEARAAGPTRTGAVMGTPSYIAPEQASGRSAGVGPGADIYSLGAILYELLTGRPPFRGETPLDTVLQVMTDEPIPPRRLQPKVPRDLETVCLKCLEKDPRRRYASAAELADDLHRFLDGLPITAQPVSMLYRGVKWAKRRPAAALLILGSIAALVAGLVISLVVNFELTAAAERERLQLQEANKQKAIAQEQTRKAEQRTEDARRGSYALQLAQVFALNERDPRRATQLLDDRDRCPLSMRDFTWGYLHRLCRRERPALSGHQSGVSAVAFAPDGSWLASTGWDRTLRLWQLQPALETARLRAHAGMVTSLAVSGDGRTLATAGDDRFVKLWEVRRPVLVFGTTGVLVWPWPVVRERLAIPVPRPSVRSVALSADGKTLVTGGLDGIVRLWDAKTGRELAALRGHTREVWTVAFSPDGKTLASGSGDRTIALWDVRRVLDDPTDAKPELLRGHNDVVTSLAFSPDGKTLASGGGGNDQSLRLWDVARRRERAKLKGHDRAIFSVAFAPDGQIIATGSGDGTIRLWDPTTGRQRTILHGHPIQCHAVAFTPDSQLLASGGVDHIIHLWELEEHREETYPLTTKFRGPVALTPDASHLVYGELGAVKDWDWNAGVTAALPNTDRDAVERIATAPGAVAALDAAGDVRVWRGGRYVVTIRTFAAVRSPLFVRSLAVTAGGRHVAIGRANGTLQVLDVESRTVIKEENAHRGPIWAVAFSPDGKTLATGGADKVVRLWSWSNSNLRPGKALEGSTHEIRALAFAPDGKRLASGSLAGLVRIWDTETADNLASNFSHTDTVSCLAFTPDGKTLASGSDDRTIKLWDPETGHERVTLAGHTSAVVNLAFAAGATHLTSVTADGAVKVWRADDR